MDSRLLGPVVLLALALAPATAAAATRDSDRDKLPDVWEARHHLPSGLAGSAKGDFDKDGLKNLTEYRRGCNPRRADTDRDKLPDAFEVRHKLKCSDRRDAKRDPDLDRLTNLAELAAGTNPRTPDTDGDGVIDGADACPLGGACDAPPAETPGTGGEGGPTPEAPRPGGSDPGSGAPGGGAERPPGIDLAVTHTSDKDTVQPGQQATFTVTITNNGADAAPGVALSDQLPLTPRPPDEFGDPRPPHRDLAATGPPTSSQGTCTAVNSTTNKFTCELGTIASGGSTTVQVTVQALCPQDDSGAPVDSKVVTSTATASNAVNDTISTGRRSVTVPNSCQ
jgi:uncharacterized repeat protein (TIGR01451 family)